MYELETLVVPEELGKWLQSRSIGHSGGYFITINALYHYWDSVIDSSIFDFIAKNKKELIEVIIGSRGYRVEEPLYYALVKGHELVNDEGYWTTKYWKLDTSGGYVSPSNRFSTHGRFLIEMSKSEWNKLGINDSNADFIRVEEM